MHDFVIPWSFPASRGDFSATRWIGDGETLVIATGRYTRLMEEVGGGTSHPLPQVCGWEAKRKGLCGMTGKPL